METSNHEDHLPDIRHLPCRFSHIEQCLPALAPTINPPKQEISLAGSPFFAVTATPTDPNYNASQKA